MRPIYSIKRLLAGGALFAAVVASGGTAFAQDDDDQRRSDRRARRQQEWSDRNSRRHQAQSDWNSRRQQEWSDRNSRRQQQWSDWSSRRQQQQSDWNSRRQQQRSDRNSRRQQEWSDRNSRRQQQWGNWNWGQGRRWNDSNNWRRQQWNDRRRRGDDDNNRRRWRGRGDDDDDDDRGRRWRRSYQRQSYYSPVQIIPGIVWNGGGWGNWNSGNNYRRDARRAWKSERRSQRRFEREQRRYARLRDRDVYNNYNIGNNDYDDDFGFNGGSDWKQQILRLVIGNVIGSGGFDGNGLNAFRQSRQYHGAPYAYDQSPVFYNSPVYNNVSTGYAHQPDYYDTDQTIGGGSGLDGLLGSLPIAELLGQYAGDDDGFTSQLLGSLLTQGYDQGFLAGQYAAENGPDEINYYDPYSYAGGVCDPYSASLGQNRKLLSEGYALGFQDALAGREDYDPASEGNVDLIGLLLNSTLSNI